ncbi:MAG TPA: DUF6029 family protein [Flavobacteriales bacterium]|nr:DUF6029 family protein [Flavobacteriales bacterium]
MVSQGCKKTLLAIAFFGISQVSISQEEKSALDRGQIHGNFQVDAQYYLTDSSFSAFQPEDEMRFNGYGNILYSNGGFTAGVRYEAYLNALLGYPQGFNGSGIKYRFAQYRNEIFDITVGSFYEQFGSGLIFRSYYEPLFGYDNAMDGFRVNINPFKGMHIKTVYGHNRLFFGNSEGIVRGVDGEINLNELCDSSRQGKKTNFIFGGSFVSKYQNPTDPNLILPANVGAWSGRINIINGASNFMVEYAYKINDPSADNKFVYKNGEALYASYSFAKKGFGFTTAAKYIDNMNFRSERNQTLTNSLINFMPALTRPHTYNLAATLYPYASQPNGEFASQTELIVKRKAGKVLGGKYGVTFTANYSLAFSTDTSALNDDSTTRLGYVVNKRFLPGDKMYFNDFNFEIKQKLTDKFKYVLTYIYLVNNIEVVQGKTGKGTVFAHIGVAELNYKFNRRHNLRMELQHMYTKQDQGSWATVVAEYSISPHWYFSALDQYNYGNKHVEDRLHYPYVNVAYTLGPNRISVGYGNQRAGLFCVGGICRAVPASKGLSISISSTF